MTEQPVLDFSGLLRRLRAELRLTQEELAEAARLSPRTVSDLERGVSRTAHKDTAGLLADAIGLTGAVRVLFVAAARGRVPAAQVLAAATTRGTVPVAPVPRELPADVTAFTGRSAELAELEALLPDGLPAGLPDGLAAPPGDAGLGPVTILVVSGTAGAGKTALAVRWAHRVAARFPGGQLYVNLRGYDPSQPLSAAEALAGFLRALGVASADVPLTEAERAARYRSLMAGRRLLVVLDNAATVEQIRPLLPGTATVVVLVTSRDSLPGLIARDGARRLDLGLLPVGEAVALLRALIGERVEADPAAAETLAVQCARLPLALRIAAELAAARPGAPLAALAGELAGLDDRLELLDAGGDPYAALASVFFWSYRCLSPDAARLFARLGLHPGQDWDRYAAAALLDGGLDQAGRLLTGLARAHLVQPGLRRRYGMHDLLRGYAARLVSGQSDGDQGCVPAGAQDARAALTRLFDYYLAACASAMNCLAPAERHLRPDPPAVRTALPDVGDRAAARAWLDTELATLVAITAHAAGNGWPGHAIRIADTLRRYLAGGHDTEGLAVCSHALDAARLSGDRAAQARALTSLGSFHNRQGRYQQAAGCHEQALTLARAIADTLTQARAVGNLAIVRERQGRYQEAAGCHEQALELLRALGDPAGEAIALHNLANIHARSGRDQEAVDLQHQAITLFRDIGHRYGEAAALTHLGEVCYRQGDYPQASGHLREALTAARDIGDRSIEAEALTRLSQVRHREGRDDEAAGYSLRALDLYRQTGDRDREAEVLNSAGEALLGTGQPGQAQACHAAALTLAGQTGNRYQQACAHRGLADVCSATGQPDEAAQHWRQALDLYSSLGVPEAGLMRASLARSRPRDPS